MLSIMSLWWLLGLVPKNLLSRMVGWFVRIHWPEPLRRWTLNAFARHFRLRLEEAEHPIEQYPCIGQLFTRKLKAGLRPIATAPLVNPVDGALTVAGPIEQGSLFQAKGLGYSLKDFVQDDYLVERLQGGWFATFYLCPTDYHRVHSAWDGELTHILHIPGTLWPVNAWSVANVPRLFAINERLHFVFKTQWGPAILAMVGATNVGEMTTKWAPDLVTNRARKVGLRALAPAARIQRGDELGVFNMGSTVVLLLPPGARGLARGLPSTAGAVDRAVLLGEALTF
jgi:phosphatidylserine decarboxylase